MCLSSMEGSVPNAPPKQIALGPFVYIDNGRTGICFANHVAGLVGILQLAITHPSKLIHQKQNDALYYLEILLDEVIQ